MRFQVIYGSGAIRLRPLGALCWKARCTKPCTDKTPLSPRLGNPILIIVPAAMHRRGTSSPPGTAASNPLLRQAGVDAAKYGVQASLHCTQDNDDAEGDDGRDEGILDGGYGRLVFDEALDEASNRHDSVPCALVSAGYELPLNLALND